MALSKSARKAIPRSKFALPAGTKKSSAPAFPIQNKAHAEAALMTVKTSLKAGNITAAQAATVRRKAAAALHRTNPRSKAKK